MPLVVTAPLVHLSAMKKARRKNILCQTSIKGREEHLTKPNLKEESIKIMTIIQGQLVCYSVLQLIHKKITLFLPLTLFLPILHHNYTIFT